MVATLLVSLASAEDAPPPAQEAPAPPTAAGAMATVDQVTPDEEEAEDLDRGTGALPASMIQDVVKKNMWQVNDCYTRHAFRGQAGRLVIEFEIDADGGVKVATKKESNLGNSTLEGCVLQSVRRMKFPQPRGGTVVTTYPFVFQ